MESNGRTDKVRDAEGLTLLEALVILLRHRWVLGAWVVAVAGLIVVATLLAPRTWSSTASFRPQAEQQGSSSQLNALASQFGVDLRAGTGEESPQFYADLVRTRAILDEVASATYPVATEPSDGRPVPDSATLVQLLEVEEETPRLAIAKAREWLADEAISVSTNSETGVVAVTVQTRWQELSPAIAERLVELVNRFNLESRQSQSAAERRFVEERLEEARDELRAAEEALETFLRDNREFRNSPQLAFRHDRLQRQVQMRQQVYTSLMQSYEQARIGEVRNTPVITVVQPPEVPVLPDSRDLGMKLVVGVFLGLFLGIVTIAVGEFMRQAKAREPGHAQQFEEVLGNMRSEVGRLLGRQRSGS